NQLVPRERVAYSFDDLLQEAWIALLKKHRHFDPARGRYTTFATRVIKCLLSDIRFRCQLVGPSRYQFSVTKMDASRADEVPIRLRLKRVKSTHSRKITDWRPGPQKLAEHAETAVIAEQAVGELLTMVPGEYAEMIRRYHGLGGQPGEESGQIARK